MVNNKTFLSIFILIMNNIMVNSNLFLCNNRICGVFLSTKPLNIIGGGTTETKKPNWVQFEHYTLWCLWVCKASDISCIGYNFDHNWHNIDLVLCNSELESISVIFWSPLFRKLKHSDLILSCCDNPSHDKHYEIYPDKILSDLIKPSAFQSVVTPKDINKMFGITASDIDKYSRVIFPITFICFQVAIFEIKKETQLYPL